MGKIGFHEIEQRIGELTPLYTTHEDTQFTYTFENFFHPYVGDLIGRLNQKALAGVLDPDWLAGLTTDFFLNAYPPLPSQLVKFTDYPKRETDVHDISGAGTAAVPGPYANYNWELFFHIPLTIAVHLSKNQRFAEAQRWFHYIFDPTCNDTSIPTPQRYWKFLRFRPPYDTTARPVGDLLALLSKPDNECSQDELNLKNAVLTGYSAILNDPFQPHKVARTRPIAYQYSVVMKYLDNLIAWGDSLFTQDTIESINEATQIYILAANLLGARPEQVPAQGIVRPKTYAQLKAAGLDAMGNAMVDLEGQFPFNFARQQGQNQGGDQGGALFGIGRTLYFCIPRNQKMLGYWDIVADRLFKLRHCMNIEGVVQQLALFDPPIDPGMLVKAAAAGIDVAGIVSGINQPIGPVRCLTLIQKALEITSEVRGLGTALLAALEKGDSEHLAVMKQGHEIQIQQLTQDVKFLQWKQAQAQTEALLKTRASALERYKYYLRLLGQAPD